MKISVIGGGPGGLYFSILTKKRLPNCEIQVFEQNAHDDAFGFGVVFSDETLAEFLSYDLKSYDLIRNNFAYWDNLDIVRNGEKVRIKGNGFCGCSRKTLLLLLHQRCREEGVQLHFNTKIDDLSALKDQDLILAADGISSTLRTKYQKKFGTTIELKNNRFLWCGSTKPLPAFSYFFKSTKHGAFCAHTYQYEKGHSTWIFECSQQTFDNAGFTVTDEKDSASRLESIYQEELDGHKLITNKSHWRQFPHIENKVWYFDNVVLLGDAKATAHYSIGSGTKLAMDCAIALSNAVVNNPTELNKVFAEYEQTRRIAVGKIQHAATVSLNWFEAMDRHMTLDFDAFSFSLMSRSKKITIENQARRDPNYARRIIQAFNKKHHVKAENCSPAFTAVKIGTINLKNRIAMTAMGQYCAKAGLINDWHFTHYTTRAIGGVGLILTEMTAVSAAGRITPYCAGIWNKEQVVAWKKIVAFIHQHTHSKIGIQLGHCGRKGGCASIGGGQLTPLKNFTGTLFSASPIAYNAHLPVPEELTPPGMQRIIQDFKAAAQHALEAGFELIELQAHSGFLLASFISPLTNKRTDEFGGVIENRMKFPIEVLKSIKAIVQNHATISVRISVTDWAEGGLTQEEAFTVASLFMQHGADIINVTTGNTVEHQKPLTGRMWQSPFSEAIKTSLGIPTITAGQIQNIDQINTLLLNERADIIALGRPLLLDPFFVHKAQAYEGHKDEVNIPKPYHPGMTHLFPYMETQRKELEEMKFRCKPKSHQFNN